MSSSNQGRRLLMDGLLLCLPVLVVFALDAHRVQPPEFLFPLAILVSAGGVVFSTSRFNRDGEPSTFIVSGIWLSGDILRFWHDVMPSWQFWFAGLMFAITALYLGSRVVAEKGRSHDQ